MRHRLYDNDGLGKQCFIAYYELTMYKYLRRGQAEPMLIHQLRDIVARVNNHSLTLLEDMLDFTLHENIYDAKLVNGRAAEWASRVNLFDMQTQVELLNWRAQVAQ